MPDSKRGSFVTGQPGEAYLHGTPYVLVAGQKGNETTKRVVRAPGKLQAKLAFLRQVGDIDKERCKIILRREKHLKDGEPENVDAVLPEHGFDEISIEGTTDNPQQIKEWFTPEKEGQNHVERVYGRPVKDENIR